MVRLNTQIVGGRRAVGRKVAYALELEMLSLTGVLGEERLHLHSLYRDKRIGIEQLAEIAVGFGRRILHAEKTVVELHGSIDGMAGTTPSGECP